VVFLGTRLGIWTPLGGIRRIMAKAIFKRVLDTIQIKIGHLKGESSESLDSHQLDIERLKAELVVSGQNIIFSSKRRLI